MISLSLAYTPSLLVTKSISMHPIKLVLLVLLILSLHSQSLSKQHSSIETLLHRLNSLLPTPYVQESAAKGLLQRLLPTHFHSFDFRIISKDVCGGSSCFLIENYDGPRRNEPEIVIKGTTGVEIASGLHWYLKYKCNAHVSWDKTGGIQVASVPKPGHLPRLDSKRILIRRPVPWNYYQNVVTSSCKRYALVGIKIPSCVNNGYNEHSHHIPASASAFLFLSRFICLVGVGEMGERD